MPLLRNGWGGHPRVYLSVSPIGAHPIWHTYRTHPAVPYVTYPIAQVTHFFNIAPRVLRKPFVLEVEHPLAMAGPTSDWMRKLAAVDRINEEIASPECGVVLNLSAGLVQIAKRHVRSELWHKLDFGYLAYPAQPEKAIPDRPFTIVTIASRWSDKGTPEALDALEILRRRNREIRMLLVVSAVPPGVRIPGGVDVVQTRRMDESLKERIYRAADVLVLPCYSDTAACFPEAYAFGVPVITTRIHHGDEFVRHGETGFLLQAPLYAFSGDYGERWKSMAEFRQDVERQRALGALRMVTEEIVGYVQLLYDDRRALESMRLSCRAFHAERFDPAVRNEKLRTIYARVAGAGGN